jgi:hypothetical protein
MVVLRVDEDLPEKPDLETSLIQNRPRRYVEQGPWIFYVVVEMKFCGVKGHCTMLRCGAEGRIRTSDREGGLES